MDSKLGSDDKIRVKMYDKDSSSTFRVYVTFFSPMQYWIGYCMSKWEVLPVQPPDEVDKIWTIIKTDSALIITCTGLEVLNLVFADSSDSNCIPKWGGDVVEMIQFDSEDTASDFYNGAPGKKKKLFLGLAAWVKCVMECHGVRLLGYRSV